MITHNGILRESDGKALCLLNFIPISYNILSRGVNKSADPNRNLCNCGHFCDIGNLECCGCRGPEGSIIVTHMDLTKIGRTTTMCQMCRRRGI